MRIARSRLESHGFESVAKIFDSIHNADKPGASFAAVVDGIQVVDIWGGSKSDSSPWIDDTLCVIASGTKGICAVAVMMCVERGLINLDSSIETLWPEFAEGGKGHVLIGDALAHNAGVPGLEREISLADLSDPIFMASLVAKQHPFVAVGFPSYHAMTFGWIAGELVRRTDGRSIGKFVREEIARPLKLDLYIGAPDDAVARIAQTTRSDDYSYSAFLPGSKPDIRLGYVYGMIPAERGTADFAKIELPGGGGVASAFAMSRLYAMLANGGELDGVRLLKSETIELACRQRSEGNDPLGGRFLRFGVGFELNPNPSCLGKPADAFGHTGAGGSTHGAWPSLRTSFSYAMGEFRSENNDGRAERLLDALHSCVVSS
ncbi:MAG: beta-lactamase family protein [Ilumatobacteraceae bacterium]|nr:beta-lactamase family protein [Ilumatobacteraceae bacterium]MBJ7488797.1 beta-lactamase family protein [Ilumatobacteraceae bacterium]